MTALKMTALLMAFAIFAPAAALANRAAPFKGLYEIQTESGRPLDHEAYFLLDAATLGEIWAKYASTPLPADLEPYRHEPSIIAGFTDRDVIFLVLERGALIGAGYLAFQNGDGEKLELRRRPDGRFDMAVSAGGPATFFLLSAPQQIP